MSTPKSLRSRMGTAMRRTSSILSLGGSRPTTPPVDEHPRVSVETTSSAPITPLPAVVVMHPSPIAESPARELAESAPTPIAVAVPEHQPIAESATKQEETAAPVAAAVQEQQPTIESAPVAKQEETDGSPAGPAVLAPSEGSATFTEEPESMSLESSERSSRKESAGKPATVPEAIAIPEMGPEAAVSLPDITAARSETPAETIPESQAPAAPIQKSTGPDASVPSSSAAVLDSAKVSVAPPSFTSDDTGSYFAEPSTKIISVPVPQMFKSEVEANDIGREETPVSSDSTARPTEPVPEQSRSMPIPEAIASYVPADVSNTPPQIGEGIWDDEAPRRMPTAENRNVETRMLFEDPFADPILPIMPEPSTTAQVDLAAVVFSHPTSQGYSIDGPPAPAMVSGPAIMNDRIPSISINDDVTTHRASHIDTDETRPLLRRPQTPQYPSYLLSESAGSTQNVNPIPFPSTSHSRQPGGGTDATSRLHNLGWIEYRLPDVTVYYVHPTLRVTTNVDLRNAARLESVTLYLDRHGHKNVGIYSQHGGETWLRDTTHPGAIGSRAQKIKGKKDSYGLERLWVDHKRRTVKLDTMWENNRDGTRTGKMVVEEPLDMEYRYWAFMEAHPAHSSLPTNARQEAMDVLTWSWTDRLLPSQRAIPAPFTQEECQELMSLLRSFGDQQVEGFNAIVFTRIVSRILMRVVLWRQANFRPNKPLPQDVVLSSVRVAQPRRSYRRALFDFIISMVCLGLPYVFLNRVLPHRDEESGTRWHGVPILVIGGCTCIVAAIVLSSSVTFLTLPGLDNIARVAGFVALLLAVCSMASTVVTIFRFRTDVSPHLGSMTGEGMMYLSNQQILLSMPLVFLAYSIIAFIVAITLYSFRGFTVTNKTEAIQRFEDYTRWTVVGMIGGLAAVFMGMILMTRQR